MSQRKLAIEVQGLKKSYGNHTVLKHVDLQIQKGEIFALLGGNGAGKTTALECMEGLRGYESGHISVNGKMGIQLQSASLPAYIRPMEAIRLFSKWKRTAIDEETVSMLGIREMGKQPYAALSTGQKRRLHLALALLGDPDILFLDEPTAGLDVEGRARLHDLIRRLREQGKTIVLASHDMAEVEALCHRIGILRHGKISFCGTAAQLTERVRNSYFIHIKTERGERTLETAQIEDTLSGLLGELKDKGERLLDIKIDRGSLEEHFLEMAKEESK